MRVVNAEGKPIDIDQIISKYLDQVFLKLALPLTAVWIDAARLAIAQFNLAHFGHHE